MQAAELNNLQVAEVDENKEQTRWSSIAGKKRKERLALLQGFVFRSVS